MAKEKENYALLETAVRPTLVEKVREYENVDNNAPISQMVTRLQVL